MRAVAALLLLGLGLLASATPVQAQALVGEPVVRAAIQSVLDMDTGRGVERLPRIDLDETRGDLTVVFAMRRPLSDDPHQVVASGTDDIFTILWAVYTSADGPRIHTVTLLGTYAVVGRYEKPREIPLVRAVLTADGAARLDWSSTATLDPNRVLNTWWVEPELLAYSPAKAGSESGIGLVPAQ
jgi:hypothetical protein